MKKKIIISSLIIVCTITLFIGGIFLYKNLDKTDYDRVYINSLEIDGRLAEYQFKPKANTTEPYKIRFRLKDNLKANIRLSLYKIEGGKELNIKLNENLETVELENINELELKLVIYIEKSYELLDKDYIDIGYLSISNDN